MFTHLLFSRIVLLGVFPLCAVGTFETTSLDSARMQRSAFAVEALVQDGGSANKLIASMPVNRLEQLSMRFTENRGQIADSDGNPRPDILYAARSGGTGMYFTRDGVSTVFTRRRPADDAVSEATGRFIPTRGSGSGGPRDMFASASGSEDVYEGHRVSMTFDGCNPYVRVSHRSPLPGYENYYFPHCPEGITDVPAYRQLVYEELYENVDLRYYSADARQYKYEFTVRPGGDPSRIALRFEGADRLYIDARGDLHVVTAIGEEVHRAPVARSEDQQRIPCSFMLTGSTVVLSAGEYDQSLNLVISQRDDFVHHTEHDDITRSMERSRLEAVWGMHLGGSMPDQVEGVAVHVDGRVGLTGKTRSADFPVIDGFQPAIAGQEDAFVTAFAADQTLLWSTFIGGSETDACLDLSFDSRGNLCVLGSSNSRNFPVLRAIQTEFAGSDKDLVVLKLSSEGQLLWSTYFGGNGWDEASAMCVDSQDDLLLTGTLTGGTDFPMLNAFQPALEGLCDCFIVKLDSSGTLLWSTLIGGSSAEYGTDIGVDAANNVYSTGFSMEGTYPIFRAYQEKPAGIVLTKWTPDGNVIWSTFFGGSHGGESRGLHVTPAGEVTIVGSYTGVDFPTMKAIQSSMAGTGDGVIVRFDSSGQLACSTYLGGTGYFDFLSKASGLGETILLIGGMTESIDYPTTDPLQGAHAGGTTDMVLGLLRYSVTEGYQPIWITYLGTSGGDGIGNFAIDASGGIFLGGRTSINYRDTYPCFINDNNPYSSGILMQLRSELPTMIPTLSPSIPHIVLSTPWPQPSSGQSTVRFDLPERDPVSISLHDANGRRILNVLEGVWLNAGTHTRMIRWRQLSPGVYFIQLAGSRSKAVTKLLIQ